MPYHIEKRNNQYCVIKDDDNTTLGCHDTREKAQAQIEAVYISEHGGKSLYAGKPIKALNNTGLIGGYLVYFTDETKPDLTGEYFTPETNFMMKDGYPVVGSPVLYNHGLDETMSVKSIGAITSMKMDETGIWVEAQLEERDEYEKYVRQFIEQGIAGWSSGALPQGVKVEDDPAKQFRWIKQWPIIEGSITLTPAMPMDTKITTLKTLGDNLAKGLQDKEPQIAIEPSSRVIENKLSNNSKQTGDLVMEMTSEQLRDLIRNEARGIMEAMLESKGDMTDAEKMEMEEDLVNITEEETKMDGAYDDEKMRELMEAKRSVIVLKALQNHEARKSAKLAANRQAIQSALNNGNLHVQAGGKDVPVGSDYGNQKGFNIGGQASKPHFGDFVQTLHGKRYGGQFATKASNPEIGNAGGYLVGQQMAQEILDPLVAKTIMFGMGVRQTRIEGVGIYTVPKMTNAPTAYRPGINQPINSDDPTYDLITANLRPIAASIQISRQQLMTTSTNYWQQVQMQLVEAIRRQIDKEILVGEGSVEGNNTGASIKGIYQVLKESNIASTNVVPLAANGRKPKFDDLINAETQVASANVEMDTATTGHVMHQRTRGTYRSLTTTTGEPLLFDNYGQNPYQEMIGYPVGVTSQIPTDLTQGTNTDNSLQFFGDYKYGEYIMGNDIEVIVDEVSLSKSLLIEITAYTFSDFIVHYPEAFYVMEGVRP